MRKPRAALPTSATPSTGRARSRHPDETPPVGNRPASPRVPGERTRRPDRLLSIPETAEQLGISDKGVRRAIERGDLAAHRIGRLLRISDEDLAAFVAVRRMRA